VSRGAAGYLGPYRLLNLVYSGATTQVWQAIYDGDQRYYAVKVLLERYRRDREHLRYLKREYQVGHNLNHERLIRLIHFDGNRTCPFLVMEWFPAPSMRALIQQGQELSPKVLTQIILQATEAVAYLHSAGWVHRDIKPDNFLVSPSGEVKLIDFALAQRMPNVLTRMFSFGKRIQGTQSYMSPEQIRGSCVDGRSDLYSLACTFYHLLGGQPPFTGSSTPELLSKHLRAVPPPLERFNPQVQPGFSELLRRALAKRPLDRPGSVAEFLVQLQTTPIFRE